MIFTNLPRKIIYIEIRNNPLVKETESEFLRVIFDNYTDQQMNTFFNTQSIYFSHAIFFVLPT